MIKTSTRGLIGKLLCALLVNIQLLNQQFATDKCDPVELLCDRSLGDSYMSLVILRMEKTSHICVFLCLYPNKQPQ